MENMDTLVMSGVDPKRSIVYRFFVKVVVKCSIDDVHRKSAHAMVGQRDC